MSTYASSVSLGWDYLFDRLFNKIWHTLTMFGISETPNSLILKAQRSNIIP